MDVSGPAGRRGFTLVELLVSVAIILVLLALMGGAVSSARTSAQVNATTNAVMRLDQIITTQFRRYESRSVPRAVVNSLASQIPNAAAARAWHIRRNMISGDMPDRWSDVAIIATGPQTPAQAAYAATWKASSPSAQYGGAECLFMIVMQGGFADCLDCNGLAQLKKGDKDGDGAMEFWDDWNNPIDYILWAPGYLRTGDAVPFFGSVEQAFASTGSVRPSLGMRPLVYSAGPDGEYGLERNGDAATLTRPSPLSSITIVGGGCGDPAEPTTATSGRPADGSGANRDDNIVNVELKAGP